MALREGGALRSRCLLHPLLEQALEGFFAAFQGDALGDEGVDLAVITAADGAVLVLQFHTFGTWSFTLEALSLTLGAFTVLVLGALMGLGGRGIVAMRFLS